MAYLNSLHFSDRNSYKTFLIWSYQLKDMVLDLIWKKQNKTEKGWKRMVAGDRTWAGRIEEQGRNHWAGSVLVMEYGSDIT